LDVGVIVVEVLTSDGVGVGFEVIVVYYLLEAIKILVRLPRVLPDRQTVLEDRS
jgi:hypothetical protein